MDDRINEIVERNLGLVGDCLKRLNVSHNEFEDLFNVGVIGLFKAALHYEERKNCKFATFAYRCINNEILMEFRKIRKHRDCVSIESVIVDDNDGKKFTLEMMMYDPKEDPQKQVENRDMIVKAMNVAINCLDNIDRLMVLLSASGYTQKELREEVDYSLAHICKRLQKSHKMIKEKANSNSYEKITRKYVLEMVDDKFVISFDGIRKEVEKKIAEIDFDKNYIPKFHVCDIKNGKVCITMQADTNSMYFLGKVLDKLDKEC